MNTKNNNDRGSMIENTNEPLKIFQPLNSILYLSFFSPIILATGIVSMSFIFQNPKGFIYLGFLIGCCLIRECIYGYSKGNNSIFKSNNTICTAIQYSKYANSTFSAFIFAFSIMYLSLPMFTNSEINFTIFLSLIAYFLIDISIKTYKNCIESYGDLLLNTLMGFISSMVIVSLMFAGGSSKYLFFNEVSSSKEMCSQPDKQTFKCSVYKNGELIGDM